MSVAGQLVLLKFPQTDLKIGKIRPCLLLKPLSNGYDDWLVCMISTQVGQEGVGLDEVVFSNDRDFQQSGLKSESVIRVSRLAVISEMILLGKIGEISAERLERIKRNLANWILGL
jgi:mRNA interferase MazF